MTEATRRAGRQVRRYPHRGPVYQAREAFATFAGEVLAAFAEGFMFGWRRRMDRLTSHARIPS